MIHKAGQMDAIKKMLAPAAEPDVPATEQAAPAPRRRKR